MSELDVALSRLEGVKKQTNGYMAKCPCHDDRKQSLHLAENNGKLLLKCFAGCSFEAIINTLGLKSQNNNVTPQITATYDYVNAEGKLLYQVVRYLPKSFKQRRPDNKENADGWIWDLQGVTPTLYHLPEVIQAIKDHKLIWITEGEKDVDNLRKQGQNATTISGGASTKWPPSLVPLFLNATVAIIPHSDEAGRKYAQYIANLLYGWCCSLKMLNLPVKDVSDYFEKKTVDNLLSIVYNTEEYIPLGAVTRDEFESYRGVNQYLWQLLLRQKSKGKYKTYD